MQDKRATRSDKKIEEQKHPEQQSSQQQKCSICLDAPQYPIGKINCIHQFCFDCIKDWANVTNLCPLCKKEFKVLKKIDENQKIVEQIKIKAKQQVYETTENDLLGMMSDEESQDENCYVCMRSDNPHLLIICDNCNFHICHTYCCDPPLQRVPAGEWFCETCTVDMQSENSYQDSDNSSSGY